LKVDFVDNIVTKEQIKEAADKHADETCDKETYPQLWLCAFKSYQAGASLLKVEAAKFSALVEAQLLKHLDELAEKDKRIEELQKCPNESWECAKEIKRLQAQLKELEAKLNAKI
jgi:hypothetical protein